MIKRQKCALQQLPAEITTTKEQDHKEAAQESSDDEDTNQLNKRLRADETPSKDTKDFP
jgi:hypothetical protein